jgi:translation initiation factor 2 beta subunit (eIF-2beta)/eIF-5
MSKFMDAVKNGDARLVKKMIDKGIDPSRVNNYAIKYASNCGDLEIVKILLADNRVDPSANHNEAITMACRNGHLEVVKLLLKRVYQSMNYNYVIVLASMYCHYQIVEMLLDYKRVTELFPYCSVIGKIIREKIKKNTEIVVILKSKSFSWLPTDLIPIIMDFVCIKYPNPSR